MLTSHLNLREKYVVTAKKSCSFIRRSIEWVGLPEYLLNFINNKDHNQYTQLSNDNEVEDCLRTLLADYKLENERALA